MTTLPFSHFASISSSAFFASNCSFATGKFFAQTSSVTSAFIFSSESPSGSESRAFALCNGGFSTGLFKLEWSGISWSSTPATDEVEEEGDICDEEGPSATGVAFSACSAAFINDVSTRWACVRGKM